MSVTRRFTCDDLFRFAPTNLDCLTETYNAPFYWMYMARWPEYAAVQTNASGRISSYLLGKTEGEGTEWHGHVSALTVAPEYRRHGAARQLMNDFEARWDKASKAYFVDLFVRVSNTAAITMYNSFGYTVYRRVLQYYGADSTGRNNTDEDAFDMRKPLSRDPTGKSAVPLRRPIKAHEMLTPNSTLMPQGSEYRSSADGLSVPSASTRQRPVKTRRGQRVLPPKSAAAAAKFNTALAEALPTMTRNIEMIAAGKLVAAGSHLRTSTLKKLADEQLGMLAEAAKKTAYDPFSKKHVKGMRGDVEMDELASLAPALKKHLDERNKKMAAVANRKHAHAGQSLPPELREGADDADGLGDVVSGGEEAEAEEEVDATAGALSAPTTAAPAVAGTKRKHAALSDDTAAMLRQAMERGTFGSDASDSEEPAAAAAPPAAAASRGKRAPASSASTASAGAGADAAVPSAAKRARKEVAPATRRKGGDASLDAQLKPMFGADAPAPAAPTAAARSGVGKKAAAAAAGGAAAGGARKAAATAGGGGRKAVVPPVDEDLVF